MTSNSQTQDLSDSLEALLSTMTSSFISQGDALLVAILANAVPGLRLYKFYEPIRSNDHFYEWILDLDIPNELYVQLSDVQEDCENKILNLAQALTRKYSNEGFRSVSINTLLVEIPDWRNTAKAWVSGEGVTNQGRVRSDNIASRQKDGLLFRSNEEVLFYQAIKAEGIPFAPLPVFLKGGKTYKRIEPDFVIIKDGIVLIVEIDGDTVHRETPADAQDRLEMLEIAGGAKVKRIRASECRTLEQAKVKAKEVIELIETIKSQK